MQIMKKYPRISFLILIVVLVVSILVASNYIITKSGIKKNHEQIKSKSENINIKPIEKTLTDSKVNNEENEKDKTKIIKHSISPNDKKKIIIEE